MRKILQNYNCHENVFKILKSWFSLYEWLHNIPQGKLFTLRSSLFTIHSSLFTLHSSLFTLHYSLFTLHSSLFTLRFSVSPSLSLSVSRPSVPLSLSLPVTLIPKSLSPSVSPSLPPSVPQSLSLLVSPSLRISSYFPCLTQVRIEPISYQGFIRRVDLILLILECECKIRRTSTYSFVIL